MRSRKLKPIFKPLSPLLFISTVALLLSGCGVKILNERIYGDEGPLGAVWYETQTTATGSVDKASWDQLRIGMVCMSPTSLADFKQEIEDLCSASDDCDYAAVQAATANIAKQLAKAKK